MKAAAVIPAYKVRDKIAGVVGAIGPEIQLIVVVDDACPEHSGEFIKGASNDPRLHVVFNDANSGVGGATIAGMRRARELGADLMVKIDGDGQMNPSLAPTFLTPLMQGLADVTKGNRFYFLDHLKGMPLLRLYGNAVLSFLTKASSGYWNIFDPTNGYIAIRGETFDDLETDKLARRYFFESDLLFRLYLSGAVVMDIPMRAVYADEKSNLVIHREWPKFLTGNARNFFKRLVYIYFLRDFGIGSLLLIGGLLLSLFGMVFGTFTWIHSARSGVEATAGTVMLAALPIILGMQSLLGFMMIDIAKVPNHRRPDLNRPTRKKSA